MDIAVNLTYVYIAFAVSIIFAVLVIMRQLYLDNMESSLIKVLTEIAESLNAGYSLDMTISSIAMKTHSEISSEFEKIKSLVDGGFKTERAFLSVAYKSKNTTFMLLADIINAHMLANVSNIKVLATNINSLSRKMADIERQNNWIMDRVKSSLLTLQFAGIVIIPLVFYMIVNTISTQDTLLTVDTNLQIFFFFLTIVLCLLNFFVLRDVKMTVVGLMMGICATLLILTIAGPWVGKFFSGFI